MSRPAPYIAISSLAEACTVNRALYAAGYRYGSWDTVEGINERLGECYRDGSRIRGIYVRHRDGCSCSWENDSGPPLNATPVNSPAHLIRYLRATPSVPS